jgi:hypothetical protein
MAISQVLTGARAKIYVNNQLVGIYETCTYNVSISTEPIHLLGRYSAAEITPTAYEAISISCGGFRIVGEGPHVLPAVPKLQDLLTLDTVTLAVVDRQSGDTILTAIGCVPNSYSGNHNARATSRITINYTGLVISDESGDQSESQGAVELP